MDQPPVYVLFRDPIDRLGLGLRCSNRLNDARVHTVGSLLKLLNSGKLSELPGIGPLCMSEIEDRMRHLQIVEELPLSVRFAPDNHIHHLGLSARFRHALLRAGIQKIGQLIDAWEAGRLRSKYGIGKKGIVEIEAKLDYVKALEQHRPQFEATPRSTDDISENNTHAETIHNNYYSSQRLVPLAIGDVTWIANVVTVLKIDDITQERLEALSIGDVAWIANRRAKKALNRTLSRQGFARKYLHAYKYSEWSDGTTVYRVYHSVSAPDRYKSALERRS